MAESCLLVPSSLAAISRPPLRRRFVFSTSASLPNPRHSLSGSGSASLVLRPSLSRRPLAPVSALESNLPHHLRKDSGKGKGESYKQWDSWTATLSGASSIPFLLLQMPQIILNARNLMSGNKAALLAVPWLGMFTGMLGNLSLVSYFVEKKEKEAIVVQTLGVVSIYVVFSQLAMAEAMSFPLYVTTSVVVVVGLLVNLLGYFNMLSSSIWSLWMDFLTVGGLSVLPQIMWSTFVPHIPSSIMPGTISFVVALAIVIMARTGRLSKEGVKFVGGLSGWTATLLFMWMPVAQMWTNYLTPDNIRGLSAFTMLLSMTGNGLMIPRALFIRDLMWFTGSAWATFFYGYANLVCMFWLNAISKGFFFGASAGLFSFIGLTLWRDTVAYGFDWPLRSLKELVMGPKNER